MRTGNKDILGKLGDGTNNASVNSIITSSIEFIIDGGGGVLLEGIAGDVRIPFDCTIIEATLLADQTGSIAIDIWKDSYANFPPSNADSITASAVPTITTSNKYNDDTLSGWTTALSTGDVLRFNIDSCTTITRCIVILKVRRS
jgi:hypothetical protein